MIKSKHNIYPEFEDQVVERWKKTSIHAVAGMRLNPYHSESRISFLLMSNEDDFNLTTRVLTFNYENEIIELYSEREVLLFKRLNKEIIERGLLVPYTQPAPIVDTTNALTDAEIETMLQSKNPVQLKAKIKNITAASALQRILARTTPDHKQWVIQTLQDRIQELS